MRKPDHERVARMYKRYQDGLSLAGVGAEVGISRQSVYEAFTRRGLPLRSREFGPTVSFGGATYAPSPDGYYRKTFGDRAALHQVVWQEHNGPIPPGMHIHHRDHNKAHNDIENLECLTPEEHGRRHMPLAPTPEKACGYCGSSLTRRVERSGALETPAALLKRQYCDVRCKGLDRRGKARGWKAANG